MRNSNHTVGAFVSISLWDQLSPVIDRFMVELPRLDHETMVLRYCCYKSFPEIAVLLNVSAQAAQCSVSRGIERLRDRFGGMGVHVTAAALSASMAANLMQPAPPGLAARIMAGLRAAGVFGPAPWNDGSQYQAPAA